MAKGKSGRKRHSKKGEAPPPAKKGRKHHHHHEPNDKTKDQVINKRKEPIPAPSMPGISKGLMSRIPGTQFIESEVRRTNAAKVMMASQDYLDPQEMANMEGMDTKRKAILKLAMEKQHAERIGQLDAWNVKMKKAQDDFMGSLKTYDKTAQILILNNTTKMINHQTQAMKEEHESAAEEGDAHHARMKAAKMFDEGLFRRLELHLAQGIAEGKSPEEIDDLILKLGKDNVNVYGHKQGRRLVDERIQNEINFANMDLEAERFDKQGREKFPRRTLDFSIKGKGWWGDGGHSSWEQHYRDLIKQHKTDPSMADELMRGAIGADYQRLYEVEKAKPKPQRNWQQLDDAWNETHMHHPNPMWSAEEETAPNSNLWRPVRKPPHHKDYIQHLAWTEQRRIRGRLDWEELKKAQDIAKRTPHNVESLISSGTMMKWAVAHKALKPGVMELLGQGLQLVGGGIDVARHGMAAAGDAINVYKDFKTADGAIAVTEATQNAAIDSANALGAQARRGNLAVRLKKRIDDAGGYGNAAVGVAKGLGEALLTPLIWTKDFGLWSAGRVYKVGRFAVNKMVGTQGQPGVSTIPENSTHEPHIPAPDELPYSCYVASQPRSTLEDLEQCARDLHDQYSQFVGQPGNSSIPT
jgi:hypothetical protein